MIGREARACRRPLGGRTALGLPAATQDRPPAFRVTSDPRGRYEEGRAGAEPSNGPAAVIPFVDDGDFRLYVGDVRDVLADLPDESVHCPCGCGETFAPTDSRGRPRRYFSPACSLRVNRVSGGGEGRRHTAETRRVLSEKAKRPKPWIRGERNGMAGRTGASNPNWQGGSSPERQRLYAGAPWRRLRRIVLARDPGCCRCGSTVQPHLHHVKPWSTHPELRFDPANVIRLCRPCHHDAHRKGVCHQ